MKVFTKEQLLMFLLLKVKKLKKVKTYSQLKLTKWQQKFLLQYQAKLLKF
ncbi:Hypothetical protein BC94_0505 [Mycoplasmopsis bovis]|uniref:Uncharacterized protein n=1 Tax=Mycoplasmopsis bovis TaxID=28903 RepID=A0A8D4A288_MYCBV|nr:Hypothetical protein BC85_0502 [Mycoplasmopsis bovis]AMW25777.1 Hypothetical protein BC94_0505 [Mycoplasmopsis bovis]AMW26408.1 Hypothetical protein BC93_0502 [Mycoplasmopsis bovis]